MPLLRRRSSTRPDSGAPSWAPLDRAVTRADFDVIEADGFVRVGDAEPLPDGAVTVSLARFLAERVALLGRSTPVGVRLPSDATAASIAADLPQLARVEIEFPKFTDGRGYSIARRLRDEHGYRGDVVAVGDVLRDQLLYMVRCGFSTLELAKGLAVESALHAFDEHTVHYQAAADIALPLWKRTARA